MTDPEIVIIGAGAAGVGAARRLAAAGRPALIVEALDRTGGRACTRHAAGHPLDLGCGWLHSAEHNPWVAIAHEAGLEVDRRTPAWGQQYRDLGFPPADRAAARAAFADLGERLASDPPASDVAADALADNRWRPFIEAMSGYLSGVGLERTSAEDYAAYDQAAGDENWRVPAGYGTLIAGALPAGVPLRLATPVEAVTLTADGVAVATPAGTIRARAAIVTVSTTVLAGDAIRWPIEAEPWREAAAALPLGCNEKLFLEVVDGGPFAPESHLIGDPHDPATGSYYIRPFGWPVIECFLGGTGAREAVAGGAAAAHDHAIGQLVRLFGSDARRHLRPLLATAWSATPSIGGGYSHALPGRAAARAALARPLDDRLFFAGEATHATAFSTAHGALESGIRAADDFLRATG